MDLTQDFHTTIHDMNTTRKSLGGRRVSFAKLVRVRVIEGKDVKGAESPQPATSSESPEQRPTVVTDENAYPGASQNNRRHSLARYSIAFSEGEDMDLTTVVPSAFLQDSGSAIDDDDEGYGDEDMDITEVIERELVREIGVHPPVTVEQETLPSDDLQSEVSHDNSRSYSEGDEDQSEAMEFTMPLKRSMRAPVEHDEIWHALRQATHSGDTPIEPELSSDDEQANMVHNDDDMALDDAVQRLIRARDSLPSIPHIHAEELEYGDGEKDDTFSSTEDSFGDEAIGDQTMNVSRVFGRASLGGMDNTRLSITNPEMSMDESELYGSIVPPLQSTPRPSLASNPNPIERTAIERTDDVSVPTLTVFHPPLETKTSAPPSHKPTVPVPFSFIPRPPTSPSKSNIARPVVSSPSKAKPQFSAAFAPPVPRKVAAIAPSKRNAATTDEGRLSPSRRPIVADNRIPAVDMPVAESSKRLSPNKKAPFQVPSTSNAQRPSLSSRRPSGYFARRKSLGMELGSQPASDEIVARSSPKKKFGLGLGRASMGTTSTEALTQEDQNSKTIPTNGKGKEVEAPNCVRESSKQAIAIPSPTRGSPFPSRPSSPAPNQQANASQTPVVDIPMILAPADGQADEDMDNDPTEQWRAGVESHGDFGADDGVRPGMLTFSEDTNNHP